MPQCMKIVFRKNYSYKQKLRLKMELDMSRVPSGSDE